MNKGEAIVDGKQRPKTFLWMIGLTYASRLHHGGLLRYFNLSRELLAQGHKVVLAVSIEDDREKGLQWLESLRTDGIFTDYCELAVPRSVPRWNRMATLLLPFRLHELAIRPFVDQCKVATAAVLRRFPADVVIVSNRQLLFIAPGFGLEPPCIGDFSDSVTLYMWRELVNSVRLRQARGIARNTLDLLHYLFQEMYSSRQYAANLVVSPVDKRVFDRLGDPTKNACIMNGVREGTSASVPKIANQLVFSGAMNFAPNCDGAIWFLDNVFPAVLQKLPNLVFVIAGANPPESLLRRAGANVKVLGYVPDLNMVLAESALYVAPLISGSGFKNKVAEAIINGTYVVGTSFAAEFLESSMKELVTVRDDPQAMAAAICELFLNPQQADEKLKRLQQIIRERFSWPAKAKEVADLADVTIGNRAI